MYTTINIWFSQKPRSGGDIFRGFNDNFSDIMQEYTTKNKWTRRAMYL